MTADQKRRRESQIAASHYAPAPNGSLLTYGFVALSVTALAMFAIARFYGIDFLDSPVPTLSLGAVAILIGFVVNLVRGRRNRLAVRDEYESRAPASMGTQRRGESTNG